MTGSVPRIIDKQPVGKVLADIGGAYDLGGEVISLLRTLKVEESARRLGMTWRSLDIFDEHYRPLRSIGTEGMPMLSLRRADLQRVLAEGLEDTIVGGAEVARVESEGDETVVTLTSGEVMRCDLLVGADGVHSAVRKALWKDGPANFCGIMAAWGWLPEGHAALVGRGQPHCGHLLLGCRASAAGGAMNGRYVWSVLWPSPHFSRPADASARKAELEKLALASVPGLAAVVAATPAEEIAVVGIWDREPGSLFHLGRAVLLGDAAHATSPLLGQGAQSAIVDGYTLARLLARHPNPAEALAAFSRRRMDAVNENVLAARKIGRWVMSPSTMVQRVTRMLFRWVPTRTFVGEVAAANKANDVSDL